MPVNGTVIASHLHICGDPWAANEYHPGDKAVWKITYDQRA
jgi:hypothetical protein